MKKKLVIIGTVMSIAIAFAVFFAMQTTPGYVLNAVRAQKLITSGGTVTVPKKYTVIDAGAFAGLADFDKVIIEGKTKIMERAFYGCTNLSEVVIEDACDIGSKAFAACPSLKTVTISSAEGTCADDAFEGHGGVTVYCRENSPVLEVAKRSDMNFKVIS